MTEANICSFTHVAFLFYFFILQSWPTFVGKPSRPFCRRVLLVTSHWLNHSPQSPDSQFRSTWCSGCEFSYLTRIWKVKASSVSVLTAHIWLNHASAYTWINLNLSDLPSSRCLNYSLCQQILWKDQNHRWKDFKHLISSFLRDKDLKSKAH